jgi:hypothetical protein
MMQLWDNIDSETPKDWKKNQTQNNFTHNKSHIH